KCAQIVVVCVLASRQEYVGSRCRRNDVENAFEGSCDNTNDRMRRVIYENRATDNIRIRPEVLPPRDFVEHRDLFGAEIFIVTSDIAANRRLKTDCFEQTRTRDRRLHHVDRYRPRTLKADRDWPAHEIHTDTGERLICVAVSFVFLIRDYSD